MTRCFVPGCKTGSASERKKYGHRDIGFFRPKTDEIARAWAKAIGREDKILTKSQNVCELHFPEQDIEKEYSYRMPDGTVITVPKERKNLKKGSVPCIFPDRSGWRPRNRKTKEKDPLLIVEESKPPDHETFLMENNYNVIAQYLNLVPLPTSYWTGKVCPTFIVWNCWTEDLMYMFKRVVLTSDFVIRVYIQDVELKKDVYNEVKNVSDIIQLLKHVSNLFPCIEREIPRSKNCRGFVPPRDPSATRKQSLVCYECSKYRSEVRKKFKQNNIATEKRKRANDLLLKRFKIMIQRNKNLTAENTKLKKKVEGMARMMKVMRRRVLESLKTNAEAH